MTARYLELATEVVLDVPI